MNRCLQNVRQDLRDFCLVDSVFRNTFFFYPRIRKKAGVNKSQSDNKTNGQLCCQAGQLSIYPTSIHPFIQIAKQAGRCWVAKWLRGQIPPLVFISFYCCTTVILPVSVILNIPLHSYRVNFPRLCPLLVSRLVEINCTVVLYGLNHPAMPSYFIFLQILDSFRQIFRY